MTELQNKRIKEDFLYVARFLQDLKFLDLVEFGNPEISQKYLGMAITTSRVSRIPMGQEIIALHSDTYTSV